MSRPADAVLVNRAMREFARRTRRRRSVAPVLHVGVPGGEVVTVPDDGAYDAGLRADLVTRALDALDCPDPLVWLTRMGTTAVEDVDLRWLAAATTAFARHGLVFRAFHVVTRFGWAERTTGEHHDWSRVRARG